MGDPGEKGNTGSPGEQGLPGLAGQEGKRVRNIYLEFVLAGSEYRSDIFDHQRIFTRHPKVSKNTAIFRFHKWNNTLSQSPLYSNGCKNRI